jgi:phosphoribosyl-ATP pyrophosphohydrolase/phosphoribosyl-AMP cyclohydrolase
VSLTLPREVNFDDHGLAVAVAQDRVTGTVLMVAFMNQEALSLTLETKEAHFWSRSRQRLWRKGETSGSVLHVSQVQVDCDSDAILLSVLPDGPACHLGRRSCFAEPAVLVDQLQATLDDRREQQPPGSYTNELLQGGVPAISRKIGEEATEVIVAAYEDDRDHVIAEVADLWFHTMVLLVSRKLSIADVLGELASRRGGPRRSRPSDPAG